jgi:hypothetical protein
MVSVGLFSTQPVRAEMIATDTTVREASGAAYRGAISAALGRAVMQGRLFSMGIDARLVKQRIDAMTDEEIAALVENQQAPAGGDFWAGITLIGILLIAVFALCTVQLLSRTRGSWCWPP